MTANTVFISNDEAFQTLKSIGISIIQNDSLQASIMKLYESTYDYHDDLEVVYNRLALEIIQDENPNLIGDY